MLGDLGSHFSVIMIVATTNFSCKGVFNQNIWGQIPPRVCTLVLFIIVVTVVVPRVCVCLFVVFAATYI